MDYGDVFGVAARNGVEETQLANAEGSDDGRNALDSSITICGVACVELVTITDPIEASLGDVVKSYLTWSKIDLNKR